MCFKTLLQNALFDGLKERYILEESTCFSKQFTVSPCVGERISIAFWDLCEHYLAGKQISDDQHKLHVTRHLWASSIAYVTPDVKHSAQWDNSGIREITAAQVTSARLQ